MLRGWARALLIASVLRTSSSNALGTNHSGCVHFMGLKLASTGSTWWCEQLNKQQQTRIKEELFTSSSRESPKRREQGMASAMSCDGGAARVRGFTISPANSAGVSWLDVARSQPDVRVVKWVRTNIVKVAVSMTRKNKLNVCGGKSNLAKAKGESSGCGAVRLALKPSDVRHYLAKHVGVSLELDAAVAATRARVHVMVYEDMQRDARAAMRALYAFLGAPELVAAAEPPTKVYKKTPDDLRDTVENFDAVEALLAGLPVTAAACPLREMLHATGPTAFPRCDLTVVQQALSRRRDKNNSST